jgi:superfamily I DNA and RNA helicase
MALIGPNVYLKVINYKMFIFIKYFKRILRSTISVKVISFYYHASENGPKGTKHVRPYI